MIAFVNVIYLIKRNGISREKINKIAPPFRIQPGVASVTLT